MQTRLQEWRKRRFLSIRELAKLSGVKPNTISDIEHGKRSPRHTTMLSLAQALNVSLDDLVDVAYCAA